MKNKLMQSVWKSEKYYQMAKQGSLDINHPGMKILLKLSHGSKEILDLGCGEGTRLNLLLTAGQHGTGIDISSKALEMGKRSYPAIRFINSDLEKIPLKSNSFNLVYSACVLEHLTNTKEMLSEAIRLIVTGGYLVLITPNFGAPNRASPPFKGSRVKKLIDGLLNDFTNLVIKKELNWHKVDPIANKDIYHSDWDTVREPYLGSLINYFKSLGLQIKYYNSCWSEELPNANIAQRIFRLLGEFEIYPFNLWGPHLVLVVKKN